ncbi:MAG TPA: DeoR/GlpR family DNA-binding transcription regulator [Glaciibacter sp.]|nr:DeoR/GlpR family DNA-binding transcription regulator [Glaciibacter sp.]
MRYTEAPARRAELLQRLTAEGYVASATLATELGVSEMTIRRDLGQLHLEGLARRVTGGATLPSGGQTFTERNRAGAAEKQAIAAACARLLGTAATVALDAGTTVAPLAELIAPGTTVVTHSVPVITASTARDDLDLVAVGGTYQSDTRAFAGPATRAGFDGLLVDVAVLSATAVDASGFLCANPLDAETKRAMATIAERVIVLVDHTKLGRRAPIRVGPLELVDVLVTDAGASDEQLAFLEAAGVEVVVAALDGPRRGGASAPDRRASR